MDSRGLAGQGLESYYLPDARTGTALAPPHLQRFTCHIWLRRRHPVTHREAVAPPRSIVADWLRLSSCQRMPGFRARRQRSERDRRRVLRRVSPIAHRELPSATELPQKRASITDER